MIIPIFIVLFVIIVLVAGLYMNRVKPTILFMGAIVVLLIASGFTEKWLNISIISPKEALSGFANEQLAIIVILLILGNVFRKSSTINSLFSRFLKKTDSPKVFLIKLLTSVGISSSVFNNTPLVAMMMPYVYNWSKQKGLSPSKFLMPLSFASILGGCITVIGTSTLLIVSGMAEEAGLPPINLFDVTPVGLAMFLIGVLFLIFTQKWLPAQETRNSKLGDQLRQFFLETHVEKGASIIGKTPQSAGLRNLEGLFLVEIIRKEKAIRPVSSEEILEEGDILFFAGELKHIEGVNLEKLGLSLPKSCNMSEGQLADMAEVVVSHRSGLSGREIRKSNFRSKFDAAIVAIHRNGERVWGHLGRIILKPGDVLLLLTGKDFKKKIDQNPDFYVISKINKEKEISIKKLSGILLGMVLAIFLTALNVISLFKSLLILLMFVVVTKIANIKDIRNAVDFNLILIIGLGLALGKAMVNSGAASMISNVLIHLSSGGNPILLLFLIFVSTTFLAAVITSKAAVAITFPISVQIAQSIGADVTPFILVVAFAGAANFITPIGYQTNLMVYGPGGYNFKDFFKIGFPLTIIYMVVTILILIFLYQM